MKETAEFDPYQPPESADSPAREPHGEAVLKDPGFVGKAALIAISLQVLVEYLMAFRFDGRDWFVVLTIAHVVFYLASIVLFLVWVHRAATNVRRLNRHAGVSPGWAVGCYFVPFVNWVAPVVSMREIIRITFVHTAPGALPSIAVAWWVSFMTSNVVLRFSQDPLIFGVWFLSVLVSWIGVMILVIRISRCQAGFRWPDGPPPQRAVLTPLLARRPVRLPPVRPSASDIESDWGK